MPLASAVSRQAMVRCDDERKCPMVRKLTLLLKKRMCLPLCSLCHQGSWSKMFYLGYTPQSEWHKDTTKVLYAAVVLSSRRYDSHGSRPAFGALNTLLEARYSVLDEKSNECMHFHLSIADIEEYGANIGKERPIADTRETFSRRFVKVSSVDRRTSRATLSLRNVMRGCSLWLCATSCRYRSWLQRTSGRWSAKVVLLYLTN